MTVVPKGSSQDEAPFNWAMNNHSVKNQILQFVHFFKIILENITKNSAPAVGPMFILTMDSTSQMPLIIIRILNNKAKNIPQSFSPYLPT